MTQDNTYDGSGQRIAKDENGALTNYFYQGDSVLYTTDGTDAKTSQNFLTPVGSVIDSARYAPSDISYYLYNKDIRNSTASILDETGAFVAKYSYDEFGQTSVDGTYTFANEICYIGSIYDWESGQSYFKADYDNVKKIVDIKDKSKISIESAVSRIKGGRGVYTYYASNARKILDIAHLKYTKAEFTRNDNVIGKIQYQHYHTINRNKSHVWFGPPYMYKSMPTRAH